MFSCAILKGTRVACARVRLADSLRCMNNTAYLMTSSKRETNGNDAMMTGQILIFRGVDLHVGKETDWTSGEPSFMEDTVGFRQEIDNLRIRNISTWTVVVWE